MFSRIAQSSLLVLVVALSALAQAQTDPSRQEQPGKTSIIIDRQFVRFTTQQGEALEWRLEATNQQGELVFASGLVYGNALEWPLLDQQGQALASGLYTYTLTTKAATDETPRTQRGHLILNRAGSTTDQVWVTSDKAISLGTDSQAPKLTVVGNETTVGGAELLGSVPRREESGERSQLQRDMQERKPDQRIEDGSRVAPAGPQATLATAGRLSKFADAAGNLADTGVLETFAGGSLVQTFGNTPATGGAFNHVVEIVAGSGKTPLTLVGGAGAMEFWKDSTPTSAIAFGVAKPAVPAVATDDIVFSAYSQSGGWFERMRLTNGGNLGIGTTNPLAKLDVQGNVNIQGNVNSFNGVGIQLFNSNQNNSNKWVLGTGGAVVDKAAFSIGDVSSYKMTILQSGNVGIGTTTPQSTLDVRGDVKLGSSGQFFATSGEENLRIVRGSLDANGNILAGSGFQVSHSETGRYHITLDTPFTSAPSVTATTTSFQEAGDIAIESVNRFSFDIVTLQGDAGTVHSKPFNFIAVGPR